MNSNIQDNYNHSIDINDRKNILISGVKKIVSFDDCEFLMDTVMGLLALKGEGLELIRLDTKDGNVKIKGLINALSYVNENNKDKVKENGFLNRLFK